MNKKDVSNFVYYITHCKSLTRQQIARRDKLISKDYLTLLSVDDKKDSNKDDGKLLNPLDVANFLSLFENPDGLKFLTHDFDPNSDMTYEKMLSSVSNTLKESFRKYDLPRNLIALVKTAFEGRKDDGYWTDFEGKTHKEFYNSQKWKELCANTHPKLVPSLSGVVESFRRSLRVVKPSLLEYCQSIANMYSDLNIELKDLQKADFYTNVPVLRKALKNILDDIAQVNKTSSGMYPNVLIRYERGTEGDFFLRKIIITHIDSDGNDLENARRKLAKHGGSFNNLWSLLNGYCDWAIEANWEGKPKRWNILKYPTYDTIEEVGESSIMGFTHILTFYYK